MGCPHDCPCSGHVGVFELPVVQSLAVVTIVFIGVNGSLPEEVVKHFYKFGAFSTWRSQTTLSNLIFLVVLGLGCSLI